MQVYDKNDQELFKKPANPLGLIEKGDLSESYSKVQARFKLPQSKSTERTLPDIDFKS